MKGNVEITARQLERTIADAGYELVLEVIEDTMGIADATVYLRKLSDQSEAVIVTTERIIN